MLRFIVPGEPHGWARARANGQRFFTDRTTLSRKQAIAAWAIEAGAKVREDALRVTVRAYFGAPKSASKKRIAAMLAGMEFPTKKPDGDNIAKIIGDALNGVAWRDDVQVVDWIIEKRWDVEPRMEIEIAPMRRATEQSAGSLQNKAA